MKNVCAWCGSADLDKLRPLRRSAHCDQRGRLDLRHRRRDGLPERTDAGPLLPTSHRHHGTSHGLCDKCAALPTTERDALLTQRRLADPRLPSAADLDAICAERELAESHERETRAGDRRHKQNAPMKKRGPTGVPAAPTRPRRAADKNGGKP